ncbi:MAG: hypothetical protein AAFZ65_05995, partial [Planctomycetota bacterium]
MRTSQLVTRTTSLLVVLALAACSSTKKVEVSDGGPWIEASPVLLEQGRVGRLADTREPADQLQALDVARPRQALGFG